MKIPFLTLVLCLSINHIQAQRTVNFSGQITNTNQGEIIYLGLEESLLPIKLIEGGTFSVDGITEQKISFFYFAKISKSRKIERQTPQIWFENSKVLVTVDWTNKSYHIDRTMPFQSLSEKIESMKENQQIDFILMNPNTIPSLFFAEKNKEKMSISDLDRLLKSVNKDFNDLIYLKRIESYVSAKKRDSLRIGKKVEDFKLPNENNELVSVVSNGNKPRLIAFLSSGCSYSIASIDFLVQLAELNNDRVEIISIWDDKSQYTWLNTHQDKKNKITWTNLRDEYGFASTYLKLSVSPTFFILDETGILTDIIKGFNKKTIKKMRTIIE